MSWTPRIEVLLSCLSDARQLHFGQIRPFELSFPTFRDKKDTGQEQIVSELLPVSELHDLAPLELIPVSELQDLAMFNI